MNNISYYANLMGRWLGVSACGYLQERIDFYKLNAVENEFSFIDVHLELKANNIRMNRFSIKSKSISYRCGCAVFNTADWSS